MMTSPLLSSPSAAFTSEKYRYVYWPCIYLVSDRYQTARTLGILKGLKTPHSHTSVEARFIQRSKAAPTYSYSTEIPQ